LNLFHADADTPSTLAKCEPLPTLWPVDTDLVYINGSTKLYLTGQHLLVRLIIQDSIERIKVSIICIDSFPDASLSNKFARDALLLAADLTLPTSRSIRTRLVDDEDYLGKIISLVRVIMCIVRGA
jgi:hypothetical protein